MANTLILLVQIYGIAGAVVAAVFVLWGIDRLDASARGAVAFRPLLVPGLVLMWPLVLLRWSALARGEDPGRRHKPPRMRQSAMALVMCLALPLAVFGGLVLRQDGPAEAPAVQLAPPGANQ